MKYIFSSNKVFEVFPDHLHSYLKVYLRYLAFAFETLHYPWIPSYITYLQFKFECHACLITTFTHPSKLFVPNNVLVSLNSDNAKVYLDAQLWVFHEEIFALYTKVRLFDLKPNMAPPSRTQVSVIIPSFASD